MDSHRRADHFVTDFVGAHALPPATLCAFVPLCVLCARRRSKGHTSNACRRAAVGSLGGDDAATTALAESLGIAPIVARLLCQRGFSDPEIAGRFLNPSLEHLHDPMLLADMGRAVERVLAAIARKERIAIHGDYDVDGITSTVILRRALEMLGADVVHFIPERLKDGYGLLPAAIERLHAEGVR